MNNKIRISMAWQWSSLRKRPALGNCSSWVHITSSHHICPKEEVNFPGSDAIKSVGGVFKEYESKSLQEESWCKGLFYLCLSKKVASPTIQWQTFQFFRDRLHFWILVIMLPWWLSGKESTCHCRRHGFDSWVEKIPWRRERRPTPVFLPGESHGQRSLVG